MEVPLGGEHVSFDLPDCEVTTCEPPAHESVDVRTAAEAAISNPHGQALTRRVHPDDTVAIVVTDVTRATPDDVLVDQILAHLERVGVSREQVTIVVGLGLHRPMADEEIRDALGEHAALAMNHDPESVVEVGSIEGCPIEIHETVASADRVISTGMVEPHQYAGFSGGAKTAVVGAGGESQIRYSHSPEMLARDGVRLGRVDDNPFREFIDEAGELAGVDFCLNVTHGPDGFMGVAAGEPRAVVRDLATTARDALAVEVGGDDVVDSDGGDGIDSDDDEYDAIVAGVGAPKDANLYQVSRAATYLALGDRNPLKSGGRIVIPATLPEGAGDGTGERRFYEWLCAADSAATLYDEMREGYEAGAQRAFVVARVLRDHDVWITNSEHPEVVEACLMESAPTVEDAIEPGSRVLVVPDALNTLLA